jgi:predicted alpha/beta superfamily hydrolase
MKIKFVLFLMLTPFLLMRAENVTLIINALPANTPQGSQVYVAGSFNGWDPGNAAQLLTTNTNGKLQVIVSGTGSIEFKFTRGTWTTVEGNETGGFLPNRTFTLGSTDTLYITILSWEDLGGPGSTAASNVSVMDNSFYMPQLDRSRRIRLYLPPDYETSAKNYPVLYMHDGQNLFDLYTSFAGEWEVDETLNTLFAAGKEVPIVVGIDNGGAYRIDEYTPWANPEYGGGDGELYARFIVETLKPYIDSHYRTKPQREYTGVMGSSLGGLVSHYIGLNYQDVFGKVGVFSPSFWYSDSSYVFAYQTGKQSSMRYFMMGGTNESTNLLTQMNLMIDTLYATGFDSNELKLKVVEGGQHNELLWRTQFGEAYQWLFLQAANSIHDQAQNTIYALKITDNKLLFTSNDFKPTQQVFQIVMYSAKGDTVFTGQMLPNESRSLPINLVKGVYYVTATCKTIRFVQKVLVDW